MNRILSINDRFRVATMALGLAFVGAVAATAANAGCADIPLGKAAAPLNAAPSLFRQPLVGAGQAGLTTALYFPGAITRAGFIPVDSRDGRDESSSIVGLWEFEFRLVGDQNGFGDNTLLDWGLATWHDDGTEIQNSAGRPPSMGNICMGVWQQVGRNKFKLRHIALGLNLMTGHYDGPAVIQALVTVDPSGNSYSGPYSITQYLGSPTSGIPFDEFSETPPAAYSFTGKIVAHRVTVN